jgi:hypothetical protein
MLHGTASGLGILHDLLRGQQDRAQVVDCLDQALCDDRRRLCIYGPLIGGLGPRLRILPRIMSQPADPADRSPVVLVENLLGYSGPLLLLFRCVFSCQGDRQSDRVTRLRVDEAGDRQQADLL